MSRVPSSIEALLAALNFEAVFPKVFGCDVLLWHADVLWLALRPQWKHVSPLPGTKPDVRNSPGLASSSSSASVFSASTSHYTLNLAAVAAIPSLNGMPGPLCWGKKTRKSYVDHEEVL